MNVQSFDKNRMYGLTVFFFNGFQFIKDTIKFSFVQNSVFSFNTFENYYIHLKYSYLKKLCLSFINMRKNFS
jgi:hypothetical protein